MAPTSILWRCETEVPFSTDGNTRNLTFPPASVHWQCTKWEIYPPAPPSALKKAVLIITISPVVICLVLGIIIVVGEFVSWVSCKVQSFKEKQEKKKTQRENAFDGERKPLLAGNSKARSVEQGKPLLREKSV